MGSKYPDNTVLLADDSRLKFEGDNTTNFYSESGLLLAKGYHKVVIGKRGAYVEFEGSSIVTSNLHIPGEERWRVRSETAYYIEYRSNCKSNVMVYWQKRYVQYADYELGKWYMSPSDLYLKGGSLDSKSITLTCCDKWWGTLTDNEKFWVHYYFYDIKAQIVVDVNLRKMHESRFELEGNKRF
jgi:hypothetical protein